ncbi:Rieske (2Fe-2S) protein [Piscinibacter sp.]|jgi:nitrite reductase/ring-hydroxylating ferredoxin subunit|uniref:Rieske (2Fe-2S) protein n=1 Tax=Piscinibacter sp. TaxID=1903157 RepID=UPI001E05DB28|nr:Rieske (2Fe-2S) protein [Piscinibacter sp.]MBK7532306.1 Rieske (2Fe-2S) protein [Piscinibacter sp.]MCC7066620.1 Rieske (2Fe-2S) protein [Planctomycetota bacterium]
MNTATVRTPEWHPVAPSHHLRAGDNIVAGFAKGEELALWRSKDGGVQAWENRCPHRGLRLTMGRVLNGNLSCAYHGWEYAPDGRCAAIPANPSLPLPKNVRVRAFAVEERSGMVWVSTDAVEASGSTPRPTGSEAYFCRSLGVRLDASVLKDRLAQVGFERQGLWAWSGALAGQQVALLINEAGHELTLVHAWLNERLDVRQLRAVQAALRLLRRDLEAGGQNRRQA